MKKILTILMAVLMLFSLTACVGEDPSGTSTDSAAQTTTTSADGSSSQLPDADFTTTSSEEPQSSSSEPEESSSNAATSSKPKKECTHKIPRYHYDSFGRHYISGYVDCVSSHWIKENYVSCVDEDEDYWCDLCRQPLIRFETQFDPNGTTGIFQFTYGIKELKEPTEFAFYIDDELVYRGSEKRHNFAAYITEPGMHVMIVAICDKNGKEVVKTMDTCTVVAEDNTQ